jgi:hypothetical protein
VGVRRVVAISESSDEDLGVRERGSEVMVEGVRREHIQGILVKKAWEGERVGAMVLVALLVTGMRVVSGNPR